MSSFLENIPLPSGIKELSKPELEELALELRTKIIKTTSRTGGHVASSLGAVELIIGMHRIFDSSKDRFLFDVSHQAYAHKLLTGRLEDFETLRTFGGLAGFTRKNESEHDVYDAGHASDSLSIAYGLATARDLAKTDEHIITLIGDGAMSGGLAFEALNNIGQSQTDMIIILNDNEMSISKNVGALSSIIGHARLDERYIRTRDKIEKKIGSAGPVGSFFMETGEAAKESVKQFVLPTGMFFEGLGIKYVGPIDGHNIRTIEETLIRAKKVKGPVLIHAITQKGKGYKPAEERPDLFHGVGPFSIKTGEITKKDGPITYTKAFSNALLEEARKDSRIVAITAAMTQGTGLEAFSKEFPNRFFDVGIAEEHAVAMSAGFALGGQKPVVAIYSTFLQRAFDQIIIDVALEKLPVVFCIDRAGLVGEDGTTHHGAFDISYLSLIPNMTILSPANEAELASALHTALTIDGPVALRYPRGQAEGVELLPEPETWEEAKSVLVRACDKPEATIFAVGRMVSQALCAAEELAAEGINVAVYNARWLKPFDTQAVKESAKNSKLLVTVEEGSLKGGFGSAVNDYLVRNAILTPVINLGLEDEFVAHGKPVELLSAVGIDAAHIAQAVRAHFKS